MNDWGGKPWGLKTMLPEEQAEVKDNLCGRENNPGHSKGVKGWSPK
jgi:hypothetical protein